MFCWCWHRKDLDRMLENWHCCKIASSVKSYSVFSKMVYLNSKSEKSGYRKWNVIKHLLIIMHFWSIIRCTLSLTNTHYSLCNKITHLVRTIRQYTDFIDLNVCFMNISGKIILEGEKLLVFSLDHWLFDFRKQHPITETEYLNYKLHS